MCFYVFLFFIHDLLSIVFICIFIFICVFSFFKQKGRGEGWSLARLRHNPRVWLHCDIFVGLSQSNKNHRHRFLGQKVTDADGFLKKLHRNRFFWAKVHGHWLYGEKSAPIQTCFKKVHQQRLIWKKALIMTKLLSVQGKPKWRAAAARPRTMSDYL